jgi:hypothetical protein
MTFTLETVGTILALALIVVGVLAVLTPKMLAHAYGVPVEGEAAYGFVRATGVRDIGFGAALIVGVAMHDTLLIAIFGGVGILCSIADFGIAYHAGGRRFKPAHVLHAGGVAAFVLMLAMALFAIGK